MLFVKLGGSLPLVGKMSMARIISNVYLIDVGKYFPIQAAIVTDKQDSEICPASF